MDLFLSLIFGAVGTVYVFYGRREQDVLFLVTGPGKTEIVRRVIESESEADRSLPAARISPESGRLVWMLDQAAAQQLTKK